MDDDVPIILVTGAGGQLASELEAIAVEYPIFQFLFLDQETLDITDRSELSAFFKSNKIKYCLNTAAYTAVDRAESEYEEALAVNGTAVGHLAELCNECNTKLIHISTDFVFDGLSDLPYLETDKTNPINAYGRTKLLGEKLAISNASSCHIIRTSWLYGKNGNNFIQTMIRLGQSRDVVRVVNDQFGSPTYAADLAIAIMEMITHPEFDQTCGIYHYSNEGAISWFDFAHEIFETAGLKAKLEAVSSSEYLMPAKRPTYSVLDTLKIKSNFSISIPNWKESLHHYLQLTRQKKRTLF